MLEVLKYIVLLALGPCMWKLQVIVWTNSKEEVRVDRPSGSYVRALLL